MQIIFQDPYASLNPAMNVFQIISEPMNIHGSYEKEEQKEIILDLLKKVGLKEEHLYRLPKTNLVEASASALASRAHYL